MRAISLLVSVALGLFQCTRTAKPQRGSVPREERELPYAGPTEVRQASTGKVTATLPSLPGGWQPNAVSVAADDRGGRPGLLDVEGGESLGGFGLDGDGVDDG